MVSIHHLLGKTTSQFKLPQHERKKSGLRLDTCVTTMQLIFLNPNHSLPRNHKIKKKIQLQLLRAVNCLKQKAKKSVSVLKSKKDLILTFCFWSDMPRVILSVIRGDGCYVDSHHSLPIWCTLISRPLQTVAMPTAWYMYLYWRLWFNPDKLSNTMSTLHKKHHKIRASSRNTMVSEWMLFSFHSWVISCWGRYGSRLLVWHS